MDQKVGIKQEPVWLEGTASTSFENVEPESANSHLKEETKPELTEPGATQLAADIKDEIIIEEQTVDQLVPLLKEEDRSSERLNLNDLADPKSLISTMPSYAGEKKTFSQKYSLEKHIVGDTRKSPHYCAMCGKTFSHKSILRKHMVVHTGLRLHCCKICGKSFTQTSSLKRHALVHTGERPHFCSICGKAFSQKSHLEIHTVVHTHNTP